MNIDDRMKLWDAINHYVTECGGDPSKRVYGNTPRQKAVAEVEQIVRDVEAHAVEAHAVGTRVPVGHIVRTSKGAKHPRAPRAHVGMSEAQKKAVDFVARAPFMSTDELVACGIKKTTLHSLQDKGTLILGVSGWMCAQAKPESSHGLAK